MYRILTFPILTFTLFFMALGIGAAQAQSDDSTVNAAGPNGSGGGGGLNISPLQEHWQATASGFPWKIFIISNNSAIDSSLIEGQITNSTNFEVDAGACHNIPTGSTCQLRVRPTQTNGADYSGTLSVVSANQLTSTDTAALTVEVADITSCLTILQTSGGGSGRYSIDPDGEGGNVPFEVECDMTTAGGGWTRLVHNAPSYNHPAWQSHSGYGTVGNSGHVSPAWHQLSSFTEFLSYRRDSFKRQDYGGNIAHCLNGRSMAEMVASGTSTCNSQPVSGLTHQPQIQFNATRDFRGCTLTTRVAAYFHTWDGGASASWHGIGGSGMYDNNGYGRNMATCGGPCETYSAACLPDLYNGTYHNYETIEYGSFWVR